MTPLTAWLTATVYYVVDGYGATSTLGSNVRDRLVFGSVFCVLSQEFRVTQLIPVRLSAIAN